MFAQTKKEIYLSPRMPIPSPAMTTRAATPYSFIHSFYFTEHKLHKNNKK